MSGEGFPERRFRTAADHYLQGRPPYAPGLVTRVVALAGLGLGDRVLDLGCGPGPLARAFAPLCHDVLALDPEPEMLRVAQQEARPDNVAWRLGSSDDLTPDMGHFRLVTMGRSFHWMDRAPTLRRLDAMVEPGGAVALFTDRHPEGPENAWYVAYRDLVRGWSGGDSAGARMRSPDWVRHESVLLDSPFSAVELVGVYERRAVTADTLVDRALSLSSTSRARLGDRADELVVAIRRSLPPTPLTELVLSEAIVAFRPGRGPG